MKQHDSLLFRLSFLRKAGRLSQDDAAFVDRFTGGQVDLDFTDADLERLRAIDLRARETRQPRRRH
jgi:hypothetical protein